MFNIGKIMNKKLCILILCLISFWAQANSEQNCEQIRESLPTKSISTLLRGTVNVGLQFESCDCPDLVDNCEYTVISTLVVFRVSSDRSPQGRWENYKRQTYARRVLYASNSLIPDAQTQCSNNNMQTSTEHLSSGRRGHSLGQVLLRCISLEKLYPRSEH